MKKDQPSKLQKELSYDELNRYHSLVENLGVGVYRNTAGPKGRFLEVNMAMVVMFEAKSKDEFMNHNVSDLYQIPAERQKFIEEITKKKEVKNWEINAVTFKGRKFTVSVNAVRKVGPGGEVYFDGIVEDITDRKRMEQELINDRNTLELRVKERTKELTSLGKRQIKEIAIRSQIQDVLIKNNEELEKTKKAILNVMEDLEATKVLLAREKSKDEAMLASIGDGVVVVNRDMRIILFNRAAAELTGWKSEEVMGKVWQELIKIKTENGEKIAFSKTPLYLAMQSQRQETFSEYL